MGGIDLNRETVRCALQFGEFKSHSGLSLYWMLDLLLVQGSFGHFIKALEPKYPLAGIVTGGYLLALAQGKVGRFSGQPHRGTWNPEGKIMVKGDKVYGGLGGSYPRLVSLVDDVVTTGRSLVEARRALRSVGIEVGECLTVMDRRPDYARTATSVRSLYLPGDFGLLPLTTI